LKDAWPLTLSALAVFLYMRIDQLMIRWILGDHDLGIYAAASKIYEGWVMLPYIISISLLPVIVRLRSMSLEAYERRVAQLYFVLFWSCALATVLCYFFAGWAIEFLFGRYFYSAGGVLVILMGASIFASMGFVSARCLTAEGMQKKILYRTLAALILNVVLNTLFIPVLGVSGAAASTLLSLFFANYVMDYVDPDLRAQLRLKNKVMANPFALFRGERFYGIG